MGAVRSSRFVERNTRELLEDFLCVAVENHQDIIASESLDALSEADMNRIIDWCAKSHLEASDNPVRARCATKVLRDLLPADHYLQTWRVPKRR